MGKLNKVLMACGIGASLVASGAASAAVLLSEGFDGTGIPAGWLLSPAVSVTTPVTWSKPINVFSVGGEFAAQAGAPDSYLFNSYNSTPTSATTTTSSISDLLITPLLTVSNGTVLSFYVKADPVAEASFPDRLQVLFSSTGGTTAASFTQILLDINPGYTPVDFPTDWSLRTVTLTGLSGPTSARFAFDYLISDTSVQGNYIGLDTVSVTTAATTVPEPDTTLLLAIGLVAVGLGARRARR